jgi:hypothetical protein
MLPIHENVLPLISIAEYWSVEVGGLPTSAETFQKLLAAFWRSRLVLVGGNGRKLINQATLLKLVARKRDHPGFELVENSEMVPSKIIESEGLVMIDTKVYIILPSDHTRWTSDIISTACSQFANLSFEDYCESFQPGILALRCTKQSLADYCDGMSYDRPRFWFGDAASTQKNAKSFGGRPSVMRSIENQMRSRAQAKSLAPTLREEATALRAWADENINDNQQLPQVRSIENALRNEYKRLKQSSGDHAG